MAATAPIAVAAVVVGPATPTDDACAAHRVNKLASVRAARVVVVVVDIARAVRRLPRDEVEVQVEVEVSSSRTIDVSLILFRSIVFFNRSIS